MIYSFQMQVVCLNVLVPAKGVGKRRRGRGGFPGNLTQRCASNDVKCTNAIFKNSTLKKSSFGNWK